MKQIALSDDVYASLETLAAEKGQTLEETIAALVKEQEWEAHAEEALQEYEVWKATHTPRILTEAEFFAELAGVPHQEHADADV